MLLLLVIVAGVIVLLVGMGTMAFGRGTAATAGAVGILMLFGVFTAFAVLYHFA